MIQLFTFFQNIHKHNSDSSNILKCYQKAQFRFKCDTIFCYSLVALKHLIFNILFNSVLIEQVFDFFVRMASNIFIFNDYVQVQKDVVVRVNIISKYLYFSLQLRAVYS